MDNKQLGRFLRWQYLDYLALEMTNHLAGLSKGDSMDAFKARGILLRVYQIHNEASQAVERLRPSGTPMKFNGAWGSVSVCEVGVEPPTSLDESLPFVGLGVVDDPLAKETALLAGSAAVEEDSEIFLVSRRGQAGTEEYPLKGELLD